MRRKTYRSFLLSLGLAACLSMSCMTTFAASATSTTGTTSGSTSGTASGAASGSSTGASSGSASGTSATTTTKRIPSSQIGNTLPTQMTENYQKYLDEKALLTAKGWTISQEHTNAATDVYWLEGKTAEGAYYKYYSYDTSDGETQVLASTVKADFYADLSKYWMSGSDYDTLIAQGVKPVAYAQKTVISGTQTSTVYVGYVYAG